MLDRIAASRNLISFAVAAAVWISAWFLHPFPEGNPLLLLIHLERPAIYQAIRWAYIIMWFTTPWIVTSIVLSLAYIFMARHEGRGQSGRLPPYPMLAARTRLGVIVGEIHHPKKPVPSDHPRWLTAPERGLYTGIAIVGAIGSGKTSCCMYPFAEQILAFCHSDPEKRIGGLVLEVKGDFCHKVRQILQKYGREADFIEMSLDSPYRYNPLHNDLEAYALAYGIASLLNNLYGRGKEPFWQQAYTNLVKFIILLHKVLSDYVTLFDVYECAINPDLLKERIEEGRMRFGPPAEFILVERGPYMNKNDDLSRLGFELDHRQNRMRAPFSARVEDYLKSKEITYEIESSGAADAPACDAYRCAEYEAVRRWFYNDWGRIEPKLRTSIVEGISVFLSLFDNNPAVKRTFCPHEVHISMNALKEDARGRTKEDIGAIRHIYLDLDHGSKEALDRVMTRTDLPQPNYVLTTSPKKYQVVWKVENFARDQAESLQRSLARNTGADPAATDSARVLRLPGLANHKYESPHVVVVASHAQQVYRPENCPRLPEVQREAYQHDHRRDPGSLRTARSSGRITQSERDWAYAR